MRLLCLPLSCVTSTQPHVAQATQIDMLVGSVANGLNSSGGFCAGTRIVVDHQRINGTSFVYSAAVPRSSRSPPRRASTSCGTRRRSSARCRRTCARSGPCSTASRWSRSPHTRPRRSSTSTYHLRRHCLHPRSRRTPRPLRRAMHRRSTLWARSACYRTSWTRRSRRACGSRGRAGSAGRSSSRRGRASASPSRLRCRARSASVPPGSSRLPSRRYSRSANECACCPYAPIRSSPSYFLYLIFSRPLKSISVLG